MRNKIYIVFLFVAFLSSCSFYLPGYNFALFNNTPAEELADAVEDEDLEEIEEILKENRSVVDFQEPKFGNTVLMLAVANNKNKSARKLLELGANPNTKSKKDDQTALMIICNDFHNSICNVEIVKNLLQFGADVNIEQNYLQTDPKTIIVSTALLNAITTTKCFEIVKLLVENGADINYTFKDYPSSSAVMRAIVSDNLEVAKYLMIEKQANIPVYISKIDQGTATERLYTITDYLNDHDYEKRPYWKSPNNVRFKQEILEFLKATGLK